MPSRPTMPATSPRRRFRFLQFSIRTLLLVTAAVAVFCNWYFQPQHRDEVLAGGELKLRRQVKVEMVDGPQVNLNGLPLGVAPPPTPTVPVYVNHGSWSLRDKDDNLLVRGQFANGVPTGWWTLWHVSGRKAAEGRLKQGAKCGLWRTWYEDGTPQMEATYSEVAPPLPKKADNNFARSRRKKWPLEMSAFPREGIAKGWYPSGRLKFVATYHADKEQGPWQVFDENGTPVNAGSHP